MSPPPVRANTRGVAIFTRGVELSNTWHNLLATSWVLFGITMGFLASASTRTGKPLWWVNDGGGALWASTLGVYATILAVIALAFRHSRFAWPIAFVVAPAHAVSALSDIAGPTGSATGALLAAVAVFLATIASLAGAKSVR